ncbi:MAG: AraC family transcriptional regulator ligand-binding domain-containing protein [bacterium]
MIHNDRNLIKNIPSVYLKGIFQQLAANQTMCAHLLKDTGLDADSLLGKDLAISFEQVRKFLQNSNQVLAPGWHIKLLQNMGISGHGALGFACVTAPTLQGSIEVLLRFAGIRVPFFWLTGSTEKGQFVLRLYEAIPLGGERQVLVELVMLAIQGLLERPLGEEIDAAEISIAYPPPAYVEQLKEAFHPRLKFNGTQHTLRFPVSWLSKPCLFFDAAMHRYLVSHCIGELKLMTGIIPAEIMVRQALLAEPEQLPSLTQIASSQNISARTLIRRLKRGNTSYQQILEHIRKTLAVDLLLHSEMTIASIAYRLNYSDPSNFGRAFRQWFNCSPGTYRNNTENQH